MANKQKILIVDDDENIANLISLYYPQMQQIKEIIFNQMFFLKVRFLVSNP